MKAYSLLARIGRRCTRPLGRLAARRRGTVIIIVLALLGILALIGFFALSFTSQEQQSATYFANSPTSKAIAPSLPADPFFNDILRQLIIGPSVAERQSVMWGGKNSLVPTMFGRDVVPYSGPGVNMIWNSTTNLPTVDQNYDNAPDDGTSGQPDNRALGLLNYSPAAAAPWQSSKAYFVGAFVSPASAATGFLYIATTGGTSGATQPGWPTTAGQTVTDGGVTWVTATSLDFNNYPTTGSYFPDPDTDITYPDNNNTFLASDTLVPNGPNTPVRVVTPSFHRPAILRNAPAAGGGFVSPYQWYTDINTTSLVLFPHTEHLAVDSTGRLTGVQRFVSNKHTDSTLQPFPIPGDAPAWGPAGTVYALGARVQPNPPNQHIYVCTTAGTSGGSQPAFLTTAGSQTADNTVVWTEWTQEGVWTWQTASGAIGTTPIDYDVDVDNDGIADTHYMDFGFPLMQDANGNQFVALGAIKVIETDSLLNLNVHGNRSGLAQLPVPSNFAGGSGTPATFISLSDHGVSASEVNPEWALNARTTAGTPDFPGTLAALTSAVGQYVLLFRPAGTGTNPASNFDPSAAAVATYGAVSYELANMEWWNLLNGRPQLAAGTPPTVSGSSFAGRWGETVSRLDPQVAAILAGGSFSVGLGGPGFTSDPFPLPGTSGVDDNDNALEGGTYLDEQNVYHPGFVQPIDLFSSGSWVTGAQGKYRLVYPSATTGTVAGSEQFPQYSQFFVAPTVAWGSYLAAATTPTTATWNQTSGYSRSSPATTFSGPLINSGGGQLLVDEPEETWTEPSAASQQPNDNIFDPTENVIQLSGGDYNALGNPGRTASLMPYNFVSNQRSALIRQRFTSTSWDLKAFGKEFFGPDTTAGAGPWDARRLWEYSDMSGATPPSGPFRFPPNFGTTPTYAVPAPPFATPDDGRSSVSPASNPTAVYPLRSALANLIQILANPNQVAWSPNTLYAVNATLTPSPPNGHIFRCSTAGTSSGTQPVWTTTQGAAVPDGSVVWTDLGASLAGLTLPQRLMSINGLTEMYQSATDSNGNPVYTFRFRPLTPHPSANPITTASLANQFKSTQITPFPTQTQTSFPAAPVPPTGGSGFSMTLPSVHWIAEPEQLGQGTSPPSQAYMQQQEWLARYDRQRLARDIYTLLYLMGGGADTTSTTTPYTIPNYATASNALVAGVRPLYTDDQLNEMAQFAVNLVDALDADNNVTVFEYDKNLADGWNLDDNAYDASDSIPAGDRGVVYGVERQQLCLNEAMVNISQPCINSTTNMAVDHPDTQWDDKRQWGFFYLELENAGPTPVDFNNAQWQIVVKPSPIVNTTTSPPPYPYWGTTSPTGEVRLILTGANAQSGSTLQSVAAGNLTSASAPSSRLTIGGMIGSSGMAGANLAIAGPPMNFFNPSPTNPAVPAPSYMVVDPNDATGTPTNTGNDYQFPIAPRAAYGTGATTPASPWFGTGTGLTVLTAAQGGLDLADPNQNSNYWVVPPSSTTTTTDGTPVNADGTTLTAAPGIGAGAQLLQFNDSTGVNILPETQPVVLRIELRRRADLNRQAIAPSDPNQVTEAADNPWIVVDHMDVPVSVMALKITGNASDYAPQIQYQLGFNYTASPPAPAAAGASYHLYGPSSGASNVSTERSQPLYHDFTLNPFNPSTTNAATPNGPYNATSAVAYARNGGTSTRKAPLWQGNSFGQDNDAADNDSNPTTPIPPHPLYQPHYDRDFTSVGELFNVPLFGPYGAQSSTTMINSGVSTGNTIALTTGLTHVMASRLMENGVTTGTASGTAPTPETLVGADYIPTDTSLTKQHYPGYGTAGFRFQHPEGGDQREPNPTADPTENRWFRLLGLVEVPTRSHRGVPDPPPGVSAYQMASGSINGALGYYRTPGKININTLRFPDIVAGLVGEPGIFNMNFTGALPTGQNLPAGLTVPFLLQDATQGTTDPDNVVVAPPQNPTGAGPVARDWWEQFIATRDGVDPLSTANGGTGLSIPGLPRSWANAATNLPGYPATYPTGSRPFHGLGFSPYGGVDTNGNNGPLESTLLRSLTGDQVIAPNGTTPAPPNFDLRRRLFELGTNAEHTGVSITGAPATAPLDYATKQRLLSRIAGNTTTRSNVFLVWIQVDFFQAKDVGPSLTPADTGVVRIGSKLGTSPGYRGFFVIDRSQALPQVTPQYLPSVDPATGKFVFSFNQSFNYQSLILYRQRIH